MRDNGIGLNERQAKFVALVAAGEMSVAQAYREAGFANSSSNADKLKKHLAEFIEAERIKLGVPATEGRASEVIEDDDKRFLIGAQKRLLAESERTGDLAVQRATLRELGKLLKKPGKPGRPGNAAPPTTHKRENYFAHFSGAEVFEFAYALMNSPETNAAYDAHAKACEPIEEQLSLARAGKPNIYSEMTWPAFRDPALRGADAPEPSPRADLKSSASVAALTPSEIVKRL